MSGIKTDLGGPAGLGDGVFSTSSLAAGNAVDGSVYVDITAAFGSGGANVFGTNYTGLYINSNGLITFGAPNTDYAGNSLSELPDPTIAVFWADHNLNNGGEIYWDVDAGSGKVTITWKDAAPYSGSGANTYQIELKAKDNGDFDVKIIYDDVEWTGGTASPALAGVTDGGSNVFEITGSGDPDALGNFATSKFKGGENENGNGEFKAKFKDGEPDFKNGTVDGSIGDDILQLTGGDGEGDIITSGNDKVLAGGGDDFVDGDSGDDIIHGGIGSDTLKGGEGADEIHGEGEDGSLASQQTISITASNATDTANGYTVSAVNVVAGAHTTASASNISNTLGGFGADGTVSDTDSGMNGQIAHDLASGLSEKVIIDFDDDIEDLSFSFTSLYTASYNEQAQWTIFKDGVQVAQGTFTEANSGSGKGTIDVSGHGLFDRIEFSSLVQTDGSDGSDFAITKVSFTAPIDSDAFNDNIDGGSGTDLISAGLGADTVIGGTGADTIFGDAGHDHIDGGADDDSVSGGDGNDTIAGGQGADTISGGTGDDYIDGGEGDDVLSTGIGQDTLVGGEGNDTLMNSAGDDSLVGGVGDDVIIATAGNDTLEGGDGADTMDGGSENDSIEGGAGDDVIYTGLGDDEAFGGDDADTFHVHGAEGIEFNQSGTDGAASASNVTDFPTNALSFEIQFSSAGSAPDQVFFASYAVPSADNEFFVAANGSENLDISIGGSVLNTGVSVSGLLDGGPHSLAVTWDSTTGALNVYADGSSIYSGTFATGEVLEQGGTFVFGQDQDSVGGGFSTSQTFDGTIHNAKLFDDVRTPAEIASDAADHEADTSDPNLIAGWIPDADTGGLRDLTGNHTMVMAGDTQIITGLGGNDTITGGEGGTDSDTLDAGAVNADLNITLLGNEQGTITDGTDTVTFTEIENVFTGSGDDQINASADSVGLGLFGNAGSDTLQGGSGDDYIEGGDDDDQILLSDGFGNDTIIGGEGGTDDDTLDLSGVTEDLTIDLSNANAETGSVSNGTDTVTFQEIENISLGGGRDTIILADGSGADTVQAFDLTDSGDGSTNDQLDVSGLTSDGGSTPVNTNDVTVTDTNGDGTGDAILTFPGGESITLVGVMASQVDDPGELAAMGIPAGPDYTVEGTAGNDTIDAAYVGDSEGDRVDNNDHSDGSNDDNIEAGAGNDRIISGAGDDTVQGGTGNDSITGGAGNDTFIYDVGDGADTITDFNTGNSGTLSDGDSSNNDSIDLSNFYDDIWELHADQADDGVLNQSNDGVGGVDYSDNDAFGSGSLTFTGASADSSSFTFENTGVVCFTSGTAIRTPRGEVLIDALQVGDLVDTLDNGPQKVRWIGKRHVDAAAMAANPTLRPVLFPKGVMNAKRDLLVSRQHAMLLGSDHLARALHLSRTPGLPVRVAMGKRSVTYIHLMFERHEIIFAEGIPSESFYPGPMALKLMDRSASSDFRRHFPDLQAAGLNGKTQNVFGPKARKFVSSTRLASRLLACSKQHELREPQHP